MESISLQAYIQRSGFKLDVNLEIPGKGVTAVIGPSGSGKTTILRCIAGLEREGQVHLKFGEEWLPSGASCDGTLRDLLASPLRAAKKLRFRGLPG